MLLPSRIILLVQVYICLVNASSVFVNQYLDGNERRADDRDRELDLDISSASAAGNSNGRPNGLSATIASRVLPEIRASNLFSASLGQSGLLNGQSGKNQILLSKNLILDDADNDDDDPPPQRRYDLQRQQQQQEANSIVEYPSSASSSLDFESYSVTISPSLMLIANDKDQEELEEKFEMHTNNHHSLNANTNSMNHQDAAAIDKSNHNPRHYSSSPYLHRQPPTRHHQQLAGGGSVGHYLSSPSSSFSSNLNLNYIHSLLLTKPPVGASSSSGNSLTSLFHQPAGAYLSSYYSSGGGSVLPAASASSHQPTTASAGAVAKLFSGQQLEAASNVSTTTTTSSTTTAMTVLDLSRGAGSGSSSQHQQQQQPTCGRQQVASGSREPRVVGGNNTYEGEFPWAVSIQRHGNHHCGGVIVGRRWILTAAHCVRSQLVGNLVVRTGGSTLARASPNSLTSHLERDYLVDQIVMHGDFSRYDNLTASQMKSSANTNNADIALLRLRHEIHWNELAWPVCFPPREAGNFSGHEAVVIGWGKLNEKSEEFSNELQKVKLTIIDNRVCQNWFRQAGREMPIDDRVICAGFKSGGKDACHGDSGGPLLSKINGHYAVVGVVSTGIGCARPLLPGLYSRVSSYINWIERHIT